MQRLGLSGTERVCREFGEIKSEVKGQARMGKTWKGKGI